MIKFVLLNALNNTILLTEEDLLDIQEAEELYLKKTGLLTDEGEYLN